jgi:antitoxin MazE
VKVDIVPIGNSRGVRIPKAMLEQCGFDRSADIVAEDGRLILRPTVAVRQGWEDAFRRMAELQDDRLLDTPAPAFDGAEWTW